MRPQQHFAFNEDSSEHMRSPVIALKSLIADASDNKKKRHLRTSALEIEAGLGTEH